MYHFEKKVPEISGKAGNPIEIAASKVPAFKAGKVFKDTVNQ